MATLYMACFVVKLNRKLGLQGGDVHQHQALAGRHEQVVPSDRHGRHTRLVPVLPTGQVLQEPMVARFKGRSLNDVAKV